MCVCIYIYMYVYAYVCVYIYIMCVHECMYIYDNFFVFHWLIFK